MGYWKIKENCLNAAKECKSISEFNRRFRGAQASCVRNGWIEDIRKLIASERKQNGYWDNYENVLSAAKSCNSLSEFHKKFRGAASSCQKNGWSNEVANVIGRKIEQAGSWDDDERIKSAASKCKTVRQFCVEHPTAYKIARKKGMIDAMFNNLPTRPNTWTLEKVVSLVIPGETMSSYISRNKRAYYAAKRNGWLDELHKLMVSGHKRTSISYIWKVNGYKNLYKVGVCQESTKERRIKDVCNSNKISPEWCEFYKCENPRMIERACLDYGFNPEIFTGDGRTEFRVLTSSQISEILEIMRNG